MRARPDHASARGQTAVITPLIIISVTVIDIADAPHAATEAAPASEAAGAAYLDDIPALADEIGRLLGAAQAEMIDCWRDNSVSIETLHVLVTLRANGPMNMSAIARSRGVSLPNATCIVDRMEERGLVERVRSARDRRVVTVRLAPAGERLVAAAERVRRELLVRILDAMSPADRAGFSHAVRAFHVTYRRLAAEGRLNDLTTEGEAAVNPI